MRLHNLNTIIHAGHVNYVDLALFHCIDKHMQCVWTSILARNNTIIIYAKQDFFTNHTVYVFFLNCDEDKIIIREKMY